MRVLGHSRADGAVDTIVFGSAGKRRRSTEEKPGDGNRTTMKDNKKAKAQVGEVQEEIGGEVNESGDRG
jgi:hypothetical protein